VVAAIHKRVIGCLANQKYLYQISCPMLKMSINRAAMIFSLVSMVNEE
jgi:hypothetical protein